MVLSIQLVLEGQIEFAGQLDRLLVGQESLFMNGAGTSVHALAWGAINWSISWAWPVHYTKDPLFKSGN